MKTFSPMYSEGRTLDQALGPGGHLLDLPVGATEHRIGLEQQVAQPPRPALDRHVLEVGELVELARQEQLPQRPMGPEGDLEHVLRHVLVVGLAVGLTGVGVHDQAGLGTGRPHRVVALVAVRRMVVPHRGDHDPLDAWLPGQALDLLHRLVDTMGDRHQRHTGTARRVGCAELDEPAVVGPGARPRETRVGDHAGAEPRTERR